MHLPLMGLKHAAIRVLQPVKKDFEGDMNADLDGLSAENSNLRSAPLGLAGAFRARRSCTNIDTHYINTITGQRLLSTIMQERFFKSACPELSAVSVIFKVRAHDLRTPCKVGPSVQCRRIRSDGNLILLLSTPLAHMALSTRCGKSTRKRWKQSEGPLEIRRQTKAAIFERLLEGTGIGCIPKFCPSCVTQFLGNDGK
uniref:Uncharacterized protein n=1 Tax=Coccidioides posadasii RMSCC 3488 TaxID=454284 RepID=A0A0J6F1X9_COCPO|nr:hypothetical protein CPAG_00445 [Coccidioides posadasii RMSCC 3488]